MINVLKINCGLLPILAVLVHHGIVRRWRCGSLVTQRPLPWLLSMTYTIVIVYDVTLLLSMTFQFQISSGKNDCTDLMGNKTHKPSIAIYRISGPPLKVTSKRTQFRECFVICVFNSHLIGCK